MRSMLPQIFKASAVAAFAALALNAVAAQTVKVPFNFSANGKTYPAGQYRIQENLSRNMVSLQNVDTSQIFISVLGPGDPQPSDKKVALKFDSWGDAHVLHSIQVGSKVTSALDDQRASEENRTANGQ